MSNRSVAKAILGAPRPDGVLVQLQVQFRRPTENHRAEMAVAHRQAHGPDLAGRSAVPEDPAIGRRCRSTTDELPATGGDGSCALGREVLPGE